jgi:hypothetical protein
MPAKPDKKQARTTQNRPQMGDWTGRPSTLAAAAEILTGEAVGTFLGDFELDDDCIEL